MKSALRINTGMDRPLPDFKILEQKVLVTPSSSLSLRVHGPSDFLRYSKAGHDPKRDPKKLELLL